MQLFRFFLYAFIIAGFVSSCNNVDFKKTKGGMPYKLFASKSGEKIQEGYFVKLSYEQKLNDSVLFTTHGKFPVYIPVNATNASYDVFEVLPTMKKGDSLYAVQLMDTFIARNPSNIPPTFKKGDKIITKLRVVDVFKTQAEAKADEEKEKMAFLNGEDKAVRDYLTKNSIQAQKTGKGTYVQIINPGTGEQVDSGKVVSLMYKGSTFAGKIFDTNMDSSFRHTEPLKFTVGTGGSITGFDEGIRVLREGGKGRLFIPSMLAYGAQPPSPDIKPFEHLIFDIEVLDVSDAPKNPATPGTSQSPH